MKIRKVEEKPMVLHTREKPKLHIQKKKKPVQEKKANLIGNKTKIKSYIQTDRKVWNCSQQQPDRCRM